MKSDARIPYSMETRQMLLAEAPVGMMQPHTQMVTPVPPALPFASMRRKWQTIGMSTEPARRDEAEAGILDAYRLAGLQAPQTIVWCGSPFSQGLVRAAILHPHFPASVAAAVRKNVLNSSGTAFKDNIADCFRTSMRLFDVASVKQDLVVSVKKDLAADMSYRLLEQMSPPVRQGMSDTVWDQVWDAVWASVWHWVWNEIDKGMRKAVGQGVKAELEQAVREGLNDCIGVCVKQHVWDNPMEAAWTAIRNSAPSRLRVDAWDALWGALQASIWDCIAVPIGESVKACANDSAQSSGYGQHDAYWLAYYDYFQEEGLRVETEKVQGLIQIASHAGWFAPHARICWICERPRAIVLNSKGELHSDNGPALDYPDGWCLYAANGKVHFKPVTS
jgi:hypothetical protein